MLKSSHLEDHMKSIGIDQSSFTRYSFEHRCMNNIKKMYQHAGICDDQQNIKDIIDAAILSNPKVVIDYSPNLPMISTSVKKPSASKSLCLFTNILGVKPKTEKRRFAAAKSRSKSMKVGSNLWTKKKNEKGIQKSMSSLNVICIHG